MLARRSRRRHSSTSFGAQWLYLRNLRIVTPDLYEFPDWDDNLRQAMARETELFLDSQLRDDRGVTELLSADYTFVNERLARHYGMRGVYGSHFRRVALPDDRRTGLLGHASILTVTSFPNRTSPVVRGKWLLENMLGFAAAGTAARRAGSARDGARRTGALDARAHGTAPPATRRARAATPSWIRSGSRSSNSTRSAAGGPLRAACRSTPPVRCPTAGRSRARWGSATSCSGRREGEFVRTVTEKLMTYAIGRGVEPYDKPAVRRIVRDAAGDDYRWSSIILGITKSDAFQMRMAAGN